MTCLILFIYLFICSRGDGCLRKLNVHVVVSPPDSLNQGSRLLLPHISTLLQYLSGIVRNTDRLKKKKFRAQVAKELNILSKLVFYLDDNITV